MKTTETEITTDIVLRRGEKVLLIKRKNDPFAGKWALPGGFVETDEKVITAAACELKEETGVEIPESDLHFIGFFDDPDRDPRGRIVSFAFSVEIQDDVEVKAGDDAGEARWFLLEDLPELGFDHAEILKKI